MYSSFLAIVLLDAKICSHFVIIIVLIFYNISRDFHIPHSLTHSLNKQTNKSINMPFSFLNYQHAICISTNYDDIRWEKNW